ncbi:MAG: choice-of-anchor G family protein, partial [Micrococcaceae bacterium]|nr:choice-of-anchor G family protein [Micrococcaceae bacterium]
MATKPLEVGKRRFLTPKRILAGTMVSSLLMFQTGIASAADTDVSEARGQVISSDVLSLDLLEAATSEAGVPSNPGEHYEPLNVGALGAVNLTLPSLQLPLIDDGSGNGLLDLGALGALHSYAEATEPTKATASAGLVGADGAIDANAGGGGSSENAKVELTRLLEQLGVAGLSDDVIDQLNLEVGAIASRATLDAGTGKSDYTVADLKANVNSPLVGSLSGDLGDVVNGVGTTLNGAVGENGAITGALEDVLSTEVNLGVAKVNLGPTEISIGNLDSALESINVGLLQSTITDTDGLVALNLADGTITIDLEKAVAGGTLNGLPANTEVISSATLQKVTDGLAEAVGSLTDQLNTELTKAINEATLTLETGLSVKPPFVSATTGNLTIDGALGDFLGTSGADPNVDAEISLLPTLLNPVLDFVADSLVVPLTQSVGAVVNPLLSGLTDSLTGVATPVLNTLSPVLSGVLDEVVSVTINKQSGSAANLGTESQDVTLPADFQVSALALSLLPRADAANVGLATSYVRIAEEEIETVAITNPAPGSEVTAPAGGTSDVPVEGTGEPGEEVVVVLDGDDGTSQTATVDEDGTWSVTFPEVEPGDHTVVATQSGDDSTAETDFAVVEDTDADAATAADADTDADVNATA